MPPSPLTFPEKRKPFDEKEVLKRFKEMTTIGITQEDAIYQLTLEFSASEDRILSTVSAPTVVTTPPPITTPPPFTAQSTSSSLDTLFNTTIPNHQKPPLLQPRYSQT